MTKFYVTVKEEGIQPWMKKLGVVPEKKFLVIGTMAEMLLMKVENNLVEIYPRHVLFSDWA